DIDEIIKNVLSSPDFLDTDDLFISTTKQQTQTISRSSIVIAYPTITPDVVDFEDPTKRALRQDLFSSSIDFILSQSIW
ncbi:hypothetical protein RM190_23320, partial [Paracoccus sp. CPCC 101403]